MSKYIIRPELNDAEDDDYERLHEEMYNREIYRVIKGADGVWYDLPTGTYVAESSLILSEFYKVVKAAVYAVINQYSPPGTYELIVANYSAGTFKLSKNKDKNKLPE